MTLSLKNKVGILGWIMLKRKLQKASASTKSVESSKIPREELDENVTILVQNSISPEKSKYFQTMENNIDDSFEGKFLKLQLQLNASLRTLTFKPPVAFVYNPVEYAFKANENYVRKYCKGPKSLLFVGMNPGPDGMCQTGVPFGNVKHVRDFLEIEADIEKPLLECPNRPVLGFAATRAEPSGQRLWTLIEKLCGTADIFFRNCFVYNYCPLALLTKNGNNLTPKDIKDSAELAAICDNFYLKIIELLQPKIIIAIGRYVEERSLVVLKGHPSQIKVMYLLHPSPRTPNNQDWLQKAERFFRDCHLLEQIV